MSLQFYEKVRVIESARFPERVGKFGYILGVSEEGGIIYSYYVTFPDTGRGLSLPPGALAGTGEIAPRSDFFDEEPQQLRIAVKGQKGFLVDEAKGEESQTA